ncbi:MAG: LysM peptidoglycan-binding domain-containing protein [Lachnospiraceae bacterium]|jgi:LysM repeat protein|nr:LysM peptidoglycan-binding domain-containing protein [Lachnospiraceae bacterium]
MGEFYAPYPKLPKNIRQIGERDLNVKLYVEDYVNTYLKRLYPAGGQDLRVGLLLGEAKSQEGMPYLFADGALEMENVVRDGEQVEFTEEAWEKAYRGIDQMFPKRTVLGWFVCSGPDKNLSPLNYWKQHSKYFPEKNQLMYLNCGLDGDESVYVASEDGFYRLRGYSIYYERNQMMQDYMVSRKEARRVESGTRDGVIHDFRQKMEENKEEARRRRSALGGLQTACGVLSVLVLACGVTLFNNYHRMRQMESVIASALPEGMEKGWSDLIGGGKETAPDEDTLFEDIPGEVYPTRENIVIEPESMAFGDSLAETNGQAGGESQETAQSLTQDPSEGQNPGQTQEPGQKVSQPENTNQPAPVSEEEGEEVGALAPEPVSIPDNAVVHTVQDGETLYGICLEYYHSVNNLPQICQWNNLPDENHLSVGQKLYMPPAE